MLLWEDESPSLEQLRVADNDQVLIEVRNKDQTWPEEMSTIANLSRAQAARHRLGASPGRGLESLLLANEIMCMLKSV